MTREELRAIICEAIGDNSRVDPLLVALEAAGVRLVPAESTRGMYDAGNAVCVNAWRQGSSANADVVYAEMLAASPYAPPGG